MSAEINPPKRLQTGHRAVRSNASLPLIAALLFGVVLQFNPISATWGLPFLRLSDAFVFLTMIVLVLAVRRLEVLTLGVVATALAVVVLASLIFKTASQEGDSYLTLMLFASLMLALCMQAIERDLDRLATWLCIGVLIGMAASLVVLVLRASGIDLTSSGLGTPQAGVVRYDLALDKPGGIWVHGNEAGHVYAIAGAFALYLSLKKNSPIIYAFYYAMFLLSFAITLNRGGLIAPTAGLVVAFSIAGRTDFLTRVALGLLGTVGLLAAITQLPALEGLRAAFIRRFESDSYADHNLSQRFETLFAGLQVALKHPFGIGYDERIREMAYQSGVQSGSSHNGIISLAFQAGLAFAGLYAAAVVFVLARIGTFRSLPFLVTAFSIPSLFFEELTLNPNFQFAIGVTISAFILTLVRRPVRRRNTSENRRKLDNRLRARPRR